MKELIIQKVRQVFPNQQTCLNLIREVYWDDILKCVECNSRSLRPKIGKGDGRLGRYDCRKCRRTFRLTHGTVFHGTQIPLQDWFAGILLLKSDNTITAYQMHKILDINDKAARNMRTRIVNDFDREKDNLLLQSMLKMIGLEDVKDTSLYISPFTDEERAEARQLNRLPIFPNVPYREKIT